MVRALEAQGKAFLPVKTLGLVGFGNLAEIVCVMVSDAQTQKDACLFIE